MLQENLMQAFCDFIANVFILRYINTFFYKHYRISEVIWLLDFFKFKYLKKEVFPIELIWIYSKRLWFMYYFIALKEI